MNKYMKELKLKIKSLCDINDCVVDNMQVRGSVLLVHLRNESQVLKMIKQKQTIRDMIDADGAGYTDKFDSYTDMWSNREDYKNTQGVEAEVNFSTLNWGI